MPTVIAVYVLVLIHGTVDTSLQFPTESACIEAGEAIKKGFYAFGINKEYYACVKVFKEVR